jgi:hypothetical protein
VAGRCHKRDSYILELLHLGRWPPAFLPQPPLADQPLPPLPQLRGQLHPRPLLHDHLLLRLQWHFLNLDRRLWLFWLPRVRLGGGVNKNRPFIGEGITVGGDVQRTLQGAKVLALQPSGCNSSAMGKPVNTQEFFFFCELICNIPKYKHCKGWDTQFKAANAVLFVLTSIIR